MPRCDKCGKFVIFGKNKTIDGVEMFLCNKCWSEVVSVIVENFKSQKKAKK